MISSKDPDAPAKIRLRIEALEGRRSRMQLANLYIRKRNDAGLVSMGYEPEEIARLKVPDALGNKGYPDYMIRSITANIARLRERLAKEAA